MKPATPSVENSDFSFPKRDFEDSIFNRKVARMGARNSWLHAASGIVLGIGMFVSSREKLRAPLMEARQNPSLLRKWILGCSAVFPRFLEGAHTHRSEYNLG
jgi:hypothetical protein